MGLGLREFRGVSVYMGSLGFRDLGFRGLF